MRGAKQFFVMMNMLLADECRIQGGFTRGIALIG
jgi:hypothetical protein